MVFGPSHAIFHLARGGAGSGDEEYSGMVFLSHFSSAEDRLA